MDGLTVNRPQTSLVLYKTRSGVTLQITPLTIKIHEAIRTLAADKLPYPDPSKYEVEQQDAWVEGTTIPADRNPEYIALREKVDKERDGFWADRVLEICVNVHNAPNRDAFMRLYLPSLERLGDILKGYSVWLRILYCFILEEDEVSLILSVTRQHLPLEGREVVGAFSYFRLLELQGDDAPDVSVQQSPSSAKENDKPPDRPSPR